MSVEHDKIIAEAVYGYKPEPCCSRHAEHNTHFYCKDIRGGCCGHMKCYYSLTPPQNCCFSYVPKPPECTTNDHAAQDAIKALWELLHRDNDCDVYIHLCAGGGIELRFLVGSIEIEGEDKTAGPRDNPLAAALDDAMVEDHCKAQAPTSCDYECDYCENDGGIRLKPALQDALKEKK